MGCVSKGSIVAHLACDVSTPKLVCLETVDYIRKPAAWLDRSMDRAEVIVSYAAVLMRIWNRLKKLIFRTHQFMLFVTKCLELLSSIIVHFGVVHLCRWLLWIYSGLYWHSVIMFRFMWRPEALLTHKLRYNQHISGCFDPNSVQCYSTRLFSSCCCHESSWVDWIYLLHDYSYYFLYFRP